MRTYAYTDRRREIALALRASCSRFQSYLTSGVFNCRPVLLRTWKGPILSGDFNYGDFGIFTTEDANLAGVDPDAIAGDEAKLGIALVW
jgi:hypothetical protein